MSVGISPERLIDAALAVPSHEHIAATHCIAQDANERWAQARRQRLDLAERIADAAAFRDAIEPADLDAYRALHDEQAAARRARTLAVDELERALGVALAARGDERA